MFFKHHFGNFNIVVGVETRIATWAASSDFGADFGAPLREGTSQNYAVLKMQPTILHLRSISIKVRIGALHSNSKLSSCRYALRSGMQAGVQEFTNQTLSQGQL